MHRPPAVAWKVIVTRWQKCIVAALVLLASLVWAGFTAGQGWGATSFALLLLLLAATLLAAMAQRNPNIGQLRWDGEQWSWSTPQDLTLRTMVCVLDFQLMMLLLVTVDKGQRHWLWIEAGSKPSHWPTLRRAIVATMKISHDKVDPDRREPQAGV